jgi:hypothetical protein
LQHENVSTQGWFTIVFFFEYLMFHPLGLLLFYLSLEGFTRFIAGLCLSEVVPSLPIVLAFTIKRYVEHRKTRGKLQFLLRSPIPWRCWLTASACALQLRALKQPGMPVLLLV